MNGEESRDMDAAWREYLVKREEKKSEGIGFGWNPRSVFEAGFEAAVVRSSGWYGGKE